MDRREQIIRNYQKKISIHHPKEHQERFMEEMQKKLDAGKRIYPRVEIVVTTQCTLNCDGCSHMMPLYKFHEKVNVDDLIQMLTAFLELVDECVCLNITGGEPFLYAELDKLIAFVNQQEKIDYLEITTNGTVIPKDEVLEIIDLGKTEILISHYACVTKAEQVINKLQDYHITNTYEKMNEDGWFDYGDYTCREQSIARLTMKYVSCMDAMYCTTLMNHKLFSCSRAAFLYDLGLVDQGDYIDLDGDNHKELDQFLSRNYMQICNYCGIEKKRKIPAGKQCKRN